MRGTEYLAECHEMRYKSRTKKPQSRRHVRIGIHHYRLIAVCMLANFHVEFGSQDVGESISRAWSIENTPEPAVLASQTTARDEVLRQQGHVAEYEGSSWEACMGSEVSQTCL
jgi:hypothetical protein